MADAGKKEQGKEGPLLAAYLIVGGNSLKRAAVIKRLKERITEVGDLSFNFETFQGEAVTGTDVVNACNTLPFASELRLVMVSEVDKLKKDAAEILITYLASPSPTAVLALIADKLPKGTRLYKAVAAVGDKAVIECEQPKRFEILRNLYEIAKRQGIELNEETAKALIARVGDDMMRLEAELQKIALAYRGKGKVSAQDVDALVARTFEAKPWEFVDAFASRSAERTFEVLRRLDSSSPHALLPQCVTRIRELICAKSLAERGCAYQLAATLKMPDWRVKNHHTWARGFTSGELRDALLRARDAELAMKSGSDPETIFMVWVLKTMSPPVK